MLFIDWDKDMQNFKVFESWRDRNFAVKLLSPLKNNHKAIIYSSKMKQFYLITREFDQQLLKQRNLQSVFLSTYERILKMSFVKSGKKDPQSLRQFLVQLIGHNLRVKVWTERLKNGFTWLFKQTIGFEKRTKRQIIPSIPQP